MTSPKGGGWAQWEHNFCDSWTWRLLWGDCPFGDWRHEQKDCQYQGRNIYIDQIDQINTTSVKQECRPNSKYTSHTFLTERVFLPYCRHTASQLYLFCSNGIFRLPWRTTLRTSHSSLGENVRDPQSSQCYRWLTHLLHHLKSVLNR